MFLGITVSRDCTLDLFQWRRDCQLDHARDRGTTQCGCVGFARDLCSDVRRCLERDKRGDLRSDVDSSVHGLDGVSHVALGAGEADLQKVRPCRDFSADSGNLYPVSAREPARALGLEFVWGDMGAGGCRDDHEIFSSRSVPRNLYADLHPDGLANRDCLSATVERVAGRWTLAIGCGWNLLYWRHGLLPLEIT